MTLRTNFNFRQQLHRRTLLKGAGVSMAMPWLSAMESSFGAPTKKTPRRFVAMTLGLGLLADNLNPKQTGREYQSSAYLKDFDDLRKDFTVVSGTSHPVSGAVIVQNRVFCPQRRCQQEFHPATPFLSISCWRSILVTKHDFLHLFWRCRVVTVPRTQKMAQ